MLGVGNGESNRKVYGNEMEGRCRQGHAKFRVYLLVVGREGTKGFRGLRYGLVQGLL